MQRPVAPIILDDKVKRPVSEIVLELLPWLDLDPNRQGLRETPYRVADAFAHWTGGYGVDPVQLVKSFDDGAEKYDGIVMVSNIPWYSLCEHHLAPFFGVAHVGYMPKNKIVGLSKIARVVDAYARRLQVQERLTNQIASTLYDALSCKGVGSVLHARHLCMESRGICKPGSITTTSSMLGAFRGEPALRAEFLSLVPKLQDVRV
jgi:GTP cyclohydrolase IA